MKKSLQWRFLLIGISVLVSFVCFLPSTPLFSSMPGWWKTIMPNQGINLGLDLQGGMHLILKVEAEKAVATSVDRMVKNISDDLSAQKDARLEVVKEDTGFSVTAQDATSKEAARKLVSERYQDFAVKREDPTAISYYLTDEEQKRIKDAAISQALETIRNRIDQFGVAEPVIVRHGTDEILVQLPGVKDPRRAIDLIGKTAVLEFKLVDDNADVQKAIAGDVPVDSELLYEKNVDRQTKQETKIPMVVKQNALMTGDVITEARVAIDARFNEPYVAITFDSIGSTLFEKITEENTKKRMAIVLDGTVYSAPVIQEKISGGRAQITGKFSQEEAKDLAIVLRAGALPAPVTIIQNVTVGPSLGQDSIDAGIRAAILGTILVILFMAIYYRLSGVIADVAMILNVVMLLGALGLLNATLTLPGIAGIILTIGMAVDSNVLIFERIREEIRAGKTIRSAIDAGYDKAFVTIIDAHVTTLITAAVLFQFGTGPIKGFAVSLSLGVIINLFTALVGTKVVFDLMTSRRSLKTLSI
ncbi:MAG: protein translocase subunit SecD [Nitrospirota bacterium]|nr:protein translocase subunit SecD [Nitrospirota bacterium]